jgi:hypothetical protein
MQIMLKKSDDKDGLPVLLKESDDKSEQTIISKQTDVTNLNNISDVKSGAEKMTARYIPRQNLKLTGEMTMLWQKPQKQIVKLITAKQRLILMVSSSVLVLITALIAFANIETDSSRLEIKRIKEKNNIAASDVKRPDYYLSNIKPAKTYSLKLAADAIISSDFKEALSQYTALAGKYPDKEEFKIAIEILLKQQKGKQK